MIPASHFYTSGGRFGMTFGEYAAERKYAGRCQTAQPPGREPCQRRATASATTPDGITLFYFIFRARSLVTKMLFSAELYCRRTITHVCQQCIGNYRRLSFQITSISPCTILKVIDIFYQKCYFAPFCQYAKRKMMLSQDAAGGQICHARCHLPANDCSTAITSRWVMAGNIHLGLRCMSCAQPRTE